MNENGTPKGSYEAKSPADRKACEHLDPFEVQRALQEAGFKEVEVHGSNIWRSPYPYVFVWLTDKGPEGRHIIVSHGSELNEPGILVGIYRHHEQAGTVRTAWDIPQAVDLAKQLAGPKRR